MKRLLNTVMLFLAALAFHTPLLAEDYICDASNTFYTTVESRVMSPEIDVTERLYSTYTGNDEYEPISDHWKNFSLTIDGDTLTYTIEFDMKFKGKIEHVVNKYERTIVRRGDKEFAATFRGMEEEDEYSATMETATLYGTFMGRGFRFEETQNTYNVQHQYFDLTRRQMDAYCKPK